MEHIWVSEMNEDQIHQKSYCKEKEIKSGYLKQKQNLEKDYWELTGLMEART